MGYCTVDDVKGQADIPDSLDDTRVQLAIDAATELIDGHTHRHFNVVDTGTSSHKTTRLYAAAGPTLVQLDDVVQVDLVETRSAPGASYVTVDADDYALEPENAAADSWPFETLHRLAGRGLWPSGRSGVRVSGFFGWAATPNSVKQACVFQAVRWLKRKDAPFGIASLGLDEPGMRLLAKLDADVQVMLTRYVRSIPGTIGF